MIEHTRSSVEAMARRNGFSVALMPQFADWNDLALTWKIYESAGQFVSIAGTAFNAPQKLRQRPRS